MPGRASTVITQTAMKPTAGYDAPPSAVTTKQIDQWSGIYWGGSFGGGFTHSRVTSSERYANTFPTNPPPFVTQGASIISDADGSAGGALADIYLGVNQQIAPSIVVGLQLEGSVGDMSFDAGGTKALTYFDDTGPTGQTASGSFRPHIHAPFMVSALARAGWLADPTTMIYGLAGWTGAQFKYENLTDNTFYEPKDQFWANGVTVGGGLEKKLAPNWSARIEYRYTNFFASNVVVRRAPSQLEFLERQCLQCLSDRWPQISEIRAANSSLLSSFPDGLHPLIAVAIPTIVFVANGVLDRVILVIVLGGPKCLGI